MAPQKKKTDEAVLRSKYSAYRKKVTSNPRTSLALKPYKQWKQEYLKKGK